jgi:hypothetical protein
MFHCFPFVLALVRHASERSSRERTNRAGRIVGVKIYSRRVELFPFVSVAAFEILRHQRVDRDLARPKDEHYRDSEKKKKLIRGNEFIWVAKNYPNTIEVSGAIRDGKQDE